MRITGGKGIVRELKDSWTNNEYRQVIGDIDALKEFEDNSFDD